MKKNALLLSVALLGLTVRAPAADALRATLTGHTGEIWALGFSPDSSLLASGSTNYESGGDVKIWDVAAGKERRILKGKASDTLSVAFSPNGKLLATGENDVVRLWEIPSGKERFALKGHRTVVGAVAFSPDGKGLAAAGRGTFGAFSIEGSIKLWNVADGSEIATLKRARGVSLAFTPDGRILAVTSIDREDIELWDMRTRTPQTTLQGHRFGVGDVAFSPDGTLLASGSAERHYTPDKTTWEGELFLWDVAAGKLKSKLDGVNGMVSCLAFSPDGKIIAVAGWQLEKEGNVTLWETATGKLLATIPAHRDWVRCLAFSPDGKTLATGSKDSTVKLWDVTDVLRSK